MLKSEQYRNPLHNEAVNASYFSYSRDTSHLAAGLGVNELDGIKKVTSGLH